MADNDIVIGVKIETGEAAKSLKQLKAEYKDQQKELEGLTVGTAEYVNQLKKLGATKDDIGDLNTTIKSFNPEGKVQAFGTVISGVASGFQAATSAAALFGNSGKAIQETLLKVQAASGFAEGIKGVAGLKDGFKDLGLVLKANPIMLIASILITLGVILYELKDKVKVIGLVFKNIGDTIGFVIDKIKAFTDWVGISTFAADKANQSIIDNAKKANEAITARYDSEIAAAQRSHKETVFLEIEKSKAILKSNQLAIDAINRRRLANGTLNEEDAKALLELQKQNSEAYKNINDSWAKYKDAEIEKDKKANEEYKNRLAEKQAAQKAASDKLLEEQKKNDAEKLKNSLALINEVQKLKDDEELRLAESEERKLQIVRDRQKKELESEYNKSNKSTEAHKALEEGLLAIDGVYNEAVNTLNTAKNEKKKQQDQKDIDAAKEVAAKKLATEKSLSDAIFELTRQSVDSAQVLTDIAFKNKLEGVKKGSKEEEAILRKQFEVNKAFQIATAIINGIQGVMAITTTTDPTFGVITALRIASQVALTATSIAKIASTKFGGGGGGSIGGGSVGAGSQGATINAPSTASTMINADGTVKQQAPSQKVYVVESEISTKQKTVATIEENAKV